jgi:hypothetical protein
MDGICYDGERMHVYVCHGIGILATERDGSKESMDVGVVMA